MHKDIKVYKEMDNKKVSKAWDKYITYKYIRMFKVTENH